MSRERVVLCGANFGRFYAQAVAAHPRLELSHVLSRGSEASRSLAAAHGATVATDIAQVSGADLAIVAVGSTISGGQGSVLASALLERGVPVLQEHPVHPSELADLMKTARHAGVLHQLAVQYRYMDPVPAFLDAAARIRARQQAVHATLATPVHLLLPALEILAAGIGALRPHRIGDIASSRLSPAPVLDTVDMVIGGVPVTLQVQNQLSPADRDNHALLWPRMAIGFPAGTLTLADLHGPVQWAPRWHFARDGGDRLEPREGYTDPHQPTVVELDGTAAPSFAEVFTDRWPQALSRVLDGFLADVESGRDALKSGAAMLSVTRLWHTVSEALGPPEAVDPSAPELLPLDLVIGSDPAGAPPADGGAGNTAEWESYDRQAEFFDLAASSHVASDSAVAVGQALHGIDPARGPVVEIGAGTGLLTAAIANATGAPVWAVEPSAAMRAVLMSRVAGDPELRQSVSVFAGDAATTPLPEHASAVVLCGVLGHLSVDDAAQLWERLRACTGRDVPVVVELMSLTEPRTIPELELATARIGAFDYRWRWSATPDEPSQVRMESTWEVWSQGQRVRTVTGSHRWRTLTLADVAAVAEPHGFALITHLTTTSTPLGVFTRTDTP